MRGKQFPIRSLVCGFSDTPATVSEGSADVLPFSAPSDHWELSWFYTHLAGHRFISFKQSNCNTPQIHLLCACQKLHHNCVTFQNFTYYPVKVRRYYKKTCTRVRCTLPLCDALLFFSQKSQYYSMDIYRKMPLKPPKFLSHIIECFRNKSLDSQVV